jgi:7-cyano-7-deazaguanine synthase
MEQGDKCVVLLSGGMDSSTLLASAIKAYAQVKALTLIYGQRHIIEASAARNIALHFNVEHQVVNVSAINCLIQGSALTTPKIKVPQGHYQDESMKQTVVPARNTILLSLALGYCISQEFNVVAYAAHAGDHAIYSDCRPEFVEAMQGVFEVAHYYPVNLWTPFLNMDKGDIIAVGTPLGVPYENTWTCYDPQAQPSGDFLACGKCGACQERLEGFMKNGLTDPITYAGPI